MDLFCLIWGIYFIYKIYKLETKISGIEEKISKK